MEPPRFLVEAEDRLRREQKRLARKQRGSRRYAVQRVRVARCQARIRRQRRWFLHWLSHDLSRRYDMVVFENLDAARLRRGNPMAQAMVDAGWGMLREMTAYKASLRSQRCVRVPARGTSQDCSSCGRRADPPLLLEDRAFRCPCGLEIDRDLNAARNILNRGLTLLTEVGQSMPELMRVEERPPSSRVGPMIYRRRRADPGKRELAPGSEGSERGHKPPFRTDGSGD